MTEIKPGAKDHRWVLSLVKHALESVHEKTKWRSEILDAHLEKLSGES
jgi:hypothetical protein